MTEFKNKWTMWFHNNRDNWDLSTFKKIVDITNPTNFWELYNNFDKIAKDKRRDSELANNGWVILRFTDKELNDHPQDVLNVALSDIQYAYFEKSAKTPEEASKTKPTSVGKTNTLDGRLASARDQYFLQFE